jgi:hypothetical protein
MPAAAVGIPEDDWQRTNACNLQHRTKEIVDIAMLIVTLLFCSSSVIMTGVWSLFLPATMPNKNAAWSAPFLFFDDKQGDHHFALAKKPGCCWKDSGPCTKLTLSKRVCVHQGDLVEPQLIDSTRCRLL